jgi:pyruvate ferredoxin oxidoreductase gamma subunit
MFQVRFHGRGGQGVVAAAELLSAAAVIDGHHARAAPSGPDGPGAPTVAFCRIADRPVRTRAPVLDPDAIVVLDTTLLAQVDVFTGVKPEGCALLNTGESLTEIGLAAVDIGLRVERFTGVPASAIALARVGLPLPNSAMLGGLAAFTNVVTLEALTAAIRNRFEPVMAERNVTAAREAFKLIDREYGREVLRVAE